MTLELWIEAAIFVGLLGFSAFFSSSEVSLFSLSQRQRDQMRRERVPSTQLIERLLSQPRRLIVTILIGNELVNVAASVLSATIVIQLLGADSKWINLFVMVPLLLIVGEITPKTLAIRNNVAFASFQARYINLFGQLITPLRWSVRQIADVFITLTVGRERSASNIVTEDMVRSLAREAVGEGALDRTEAQYINRIFDFGDHVLRERMVPRSQILFLDAAMSLDEMAAALAGAGLNKAPVFDGSRDNVIGSVFARDLLGIDLTAIAPSDQRRRLEAIMRESYFVPETRAVADLFHTFRKRHLSLALAVDEYGGVTGLITMEDLVECIFGDFPSHAELVDPREAEIEILSDGRAQVDGAITVERFNATVGADLSTEHAETLGGLLLHLFGELPAEGATRVVRGHRFTVARVDAHRIADVVVELSVEHLAGDSPVRAELEPAPADGTDGGGEP